MYKYLISIILLSASSNIYACGDTSMYRAMDYAGYITFTLVAISAFLLPISILLATRAAKALHIALVSMVTITGTIVSIALAAIDTHPYMVPAAISLTAISFFLPVAYLFVMSIKLYRSGHAAPNK